MACSCIHRTSTFAPGPPPIALISSLGRTGKPNGYMFNRACRKLMDLSFSVADLIEEVRSGHPSNRLNYRAMTAA